MVNQVDDVVLFLEQILKHSDELLLFVNHRVNRHVLHLCHELMYVELVLP